MLVKVKPKDKIKNTIICGFTVDYSKREWLSDIQVIHQVIIVGVDLIFK